MKQHDGVRLTRRTMSLGLAMSLGTAMAMPRLALAAPPGNRATGLVFESGTLVLAAGGLWRSGDGGSRWTAIPSDLGEPMTALAAHPARPGRLLAALEAGGVAVSEDGGATWIKAGAGLPAKPGLALAVAAQEPDTVYLSVADDGLWQSEDAGATWTFAMDRPWLDEAEHDVVALASVNSPSGMGGIWIYAGTEVGLTRVPDCFCRWQDVQPGDAMDALAAGEQPVPEKPLPKGETVRSLALAPDVPETIFASTPSGLWKSKDAGVGWDKISGAVARQLTVDPADPDHIVAATEGGILSSRDGGLTWAEPGA